MKVDIKEYKSFCKEVGKAAKADFSTAYAMAVSQITNYTKNATQLKRYSLMTQSIAYESHMERLRELGQVALYIGIWFSGAGFAPVITDIPKEDELTFLIHSTISLAFLIVSLVITTIRLNSVTKRGSIIFDIALSETFKKEAKNEELTRIATIRRKEEE